MNETKEQAKQVEQTMWMKAKEEVGLQFMSCE